jgi:hypothetical protein
MHLCALVVGLGAANSAKVETSAYAVANMTIQKSTYSFHSKVSFSCQSQPAMESAQLLR